MTFTLRDMAFLTASAGGGGDADPHFANVSLLCGFDGSAVDESSNNFAVTLVGNAAVSAVDPIHGTGSLSLSGYGTGDWASVPANAAFDFGSGDFTIEAWVSFEGDENGRFIVSQWAPSPNENASWIFYRNYTGNLAFDFRSSTMGYTVVEGPAFPTTLGENYYVAVSRSGSTFTFSINGSTATASNSSAINTAASTPVLIGARGSSTTYGELDGKLDEVRITKGVARDISVVPSGKFPRS